MYHDFKASWRHPQYDKNGKVLCGIWWTNLDVWRRLGQYKTPEEVMIDGELHYSMRFMPNGMVLELTWGKWETIDGNKTKVENPKRHKMHKEIRRRLNNIWYSGEIWDYIYSKDGRLVKYTKKPC